MYYGGLRRDPRREWCYVWPDGRAVHVLRATGDLFHPK